MFSCFLVGMCAGCIGDGPVVGFRLCFGTVKLEGRKSLGELIVWDGKAFDMRCGIQRVNERKIKEMTGYPRSSESHDNQNQKQACGGIM